jgi:hypothetical protein
MFHKCIPKPMYNLYYLSNCCHTYSIVSWLHYLTIMWFNSHEPFPNSIHALVKNKVSFHYSWVSPNPFKSFNLVIQTLKSISCKSSLLPYLSYHRIIRNLKCWTNPFNCLSYLILLLLESCVYVVLFLCYSLVRRETCLLRGLKVRKLQKGKWHTYFNPFILCISVFLVVRMIGWFSNGFMKCLDPSSVIPSFKPHLLGLSAILWKWCQCFISLLVKEFFW